MGIYGISTCPSSAYPVYTAIFSWVLFCCFLASRIFPHCRETLLLFLWKFIQICLYRKTLKNLSSYEGRQIWQEMRGELGPSGQRDWEKEWEVGACGDGWRLAGIGRDWSDEEPGGGNQDWVGKENGSGTKRQDWNVWKGWGTKIKLVGDGVERCLQVLEYSPPEPGMEF